MYNTEKVCVTGGQVLVAILCTQIKTFLMSSKECLMEVTHYLMT